MTSTVTRKRKKVGHFYIYRKEVYYIIKKNSLENKI